MTDDDPIRTDGDHYRVVLENEFVRVLQYDDEPGESTSSHVHPNSVMVTMTPFRRRLTTPAGEREVQLPAGQVLWLPAQRHAGRNIGTTPTRTILVELKGAAAGVVDDAVLGPVL